MSGESKGVQAVVTGEGGRRTEGSEPRAPETSPDVQPLAPELKEAVEDFYRGSLKRLTRYLIILGARMPDAGVIAHEAIVETMTRWTEIDKPYGYTRRVAATMYYRSTEELQKVAPTADLDCPAISGDGLAAALDDESFEWVMTALNSLSWRQRQVLAMRYDGASNTDIAAELGMKANAVAQNYYLACKAIRDRISSGSIPDPRGTND